MNAFNIRAVSNFNEVTYHFLRAIFEHLHLTKGSAHGGAMPAAGGGGFGAAPAVGGGFGGAPQQQQAMGGGATTFAGAGGADSCQSAIMAILQQCQTDTGLHINEVREGMGAQSVTVAGRLLPSVCSVCASRCSLVSCRCC
jgi:replication factor A2